MIERSEPFTNLATAILAVQKAVQGVKRDSTNPHFKNSYASLEAVVSAIRPHCVDAGIVVIQAPSSADDKGLTPVETLIVHAKSGEWLKSTLALPVMKQDAQGVGSAISYASRYSLMALFNLPATDDDGDAASKAKTNGNGAADHGINNTDPINVSEIAALRAQIVTTGADLPKFLGYMRVDRLEEITVGQLPKAKHALAQKAKVPA